jgi:hypothetical protein
VEVGEREGRGRGSMMGDADVCEGGVERPGVRGSVMGGAGGVNVLSQLWQGYYM